MKRFLSFLLVSLVAVSVMAQYDDGIESYRVVYKGKAPTISDFVSTILGMEDCGEVLGSFSDYWKRYQKGMKMPRNIILDVESKNGYIFYDQSYPDDDAHVSVTTCYWNCSDGRHKLVGQVITTFQNGRSVAGQYDGLTFYTYDSVTKRLKWTPIVDVCGDEFNEIGLTDGTVISLPAEGKDISLWLNTSNGMKHYTLKWNGGGFDFIKK